MARNGVWELERLVVKYSPTAGSSVGVRDFVEKGLVKFAQENPHIRIKTKLQTGHPHIVGSYITGLTRGWCLKNLSEKEVNQKVLLMRNTLGRKVPRHSEISNRVVEQKRLSVQGVWRNKETSVFEWPKEKDHREYIERHYDLRDVIDDVGVSGVVHITQQLLKEEVDKQQAAIANAPKKFRVAASE